MSFKKILCPLDFSTGSQQGMRAAIQLASDHDAELVLVHVWSIPAMAGGEFGLAGDVIDAIIDDAQHRLDAARRDAETRGAKRISCQLLQGTVWQQLADLAASDPAIGLIVMATHGRTGAARILLGSVTEATVRHAPCSVLTVRGAQPRFEKVLCAVDFSESTQAVVDTVAELLRPGAEITLLHVVDMPLDLQYPGLQRELQTKAAAQLDELAARVSLPVTQRICSGAAGAHILAALDESAFDLAIVGSHGRTGIARMLLGSVAEKIIRHARCSVAVARRRS